MWEEKRHGASLRMTMKRYFSCWNLKRKIKSQTLTLYIHIIKEEEDGEVKECKKWSKRGLNRGWEASRRSLDGVYKVGS